MASYLNAYIEYRKKDDPNWHLLKLYSPYQKHTSSSFDGEKWTHMTDEPNAVTTQGEKLDSHSCMWYQGSIRDFFSPISMSDVGDDFIDRGWPEDMSDELKAKFKEELTEKDSNGSRLGKWWYNESHCTLAELHSVLDDFLSKFKSKVSRYYEKEYARKTQNKLDQILGLLSKEPVKHQDEEDEEFVEDIDYLWDEEFFDILMLKHFVYHVHALAEDYAEIYSDHDIRLIMYFS
jgi:hypothetical protein